MTPVIHLLAWLFAFASDSILATVGVQSDSTTHTVATEDSTAKNREEEAMQEPHARLFIWLRPGDDRAAMLLRLSSGELFPLERNISDQDTGRVFENGYLGPFSRAALDSVVFAWLGQPVDSEGREKETLPATFRSVRRSLPDSAGHIAQLEIMVAGDGFALPEATTPHRPLRDPRLWLFFLLGMITTGIAAWALGRRRNAGVRKPAVTAGPSSEQAELAPSEIHGEGKAEEGSDIDALAAMALAAHSRIRGTASEVNSDPPIPKDPRQWLMRLPDEWSTLVDRLEHALAEARSAQDAAMEATEVRVRTEKRVEGLERALHELPELTGRIKSLEGMLADQTRTAGALETELQRKTDEVRLATRSALLLQRIEAVSRIDRHVQQGERSLFDRMGTDLPDGVLLMFLLKHATLNMVRAVLEDDVRRIAVSVGNLMPILTGLQGISNGFLNGRMELERLAGEYGTERIRVPTSVAGFHPSAGLFEAIVKRLGQSSVLPREARVTAYIYDLDDQGAALKAGT